MKQSMETQQTAIYIYTCCGKTYIGIQKQATIYICANCDKALIHKTLRISFSLDSYANKTAIVSSR